MIRHRPRQHLRHSTLSIALIKNSDAVGSRRSRSKIMLKFNRPKAAATRMKCCPPMLIVLQALGPYNRVWWVGILGSRARSDPWPASTRSSPPIRPVPAPALPRDDKHFDMRPKPSDDNAATHAIGLSAYRSHPDGSAGSRSGRITQRSRRICNYFTRNAQGVLYAIGGLPESSGASRRNPSDDPQVPSRSSALRSGKGRA
jgi:hypothetical protein